jgi:ABC-type multidrug transport system fused ATPase/permease subunit
LGFAGFARKFRRRFAGRFSFFSGSIAENIRLGNAAIDDEKIRWAAREVHADEFVEKLAGRVTKRK